ncbi:VC_2705 family sodium/solute symporter [Ramlibacter sp. MAHUQ-53]|uniref:VC_2705 family sodium/solute symporter n=1 Tax=unclassified Ramlibacter TaxID=2617605 RepID=UPI0036337185
MSAAPGRLHRNMALYVAGLVAVLAALHAAEEGGLSRRWLGPAFLFASVMMYAVIGIWCRTTDPLEYYVAGRRIPAFYNGMATAADWMSAASFISLAGALYLQGFSGAPGSAGGLAYIMGWTGGFCLLALLVAPYLRSLSLYTVPDYFQLRYGGTWPRRIAAIATVLCSFVYVVAQIYGIGLIASRLTGVQFEIGILLGLGGVLLCSFLGGMRAITWTQVAQYVVLLLAFLIPVSWLAYKQLGSPFAPAVYGQQLDKIAILEKELTDARAERQVQMAFQQRAIEYSLKLQDVDQALRAEREQARGRLQALREQGADAMTVAAAHRDLAEIPRDAATAREQWLRTVQDSEARSQPLGGLPLHTQPFAGDPAGSPEDRAAFQSSRLNFLALMFCLMAGTLGLPHLLTRFYTTSSVSQARSSVGWALFFIGLLYVSAPALAALVKYEVMQGLTGIRFSELPTWIVQWSRVDPALISVRDMNGDGLLQFSELRLGADIIMLATPEIGGLPYVVSALVAAGGLAAALSTADALLLTISSALVRDLYVPDVSGSTTPEQRVILSKFALLAVAVVAATVAMFKPSDILSLVTASFSLAAAALVPGMVLGIFWRGATGRGAAWGMLAGLGVTVFYMLSNAAWLRGLLHLHTPQSLWWSIQPVSGGVFGVAAGVAVTVVASLATRARLAPATQPAPGNP